MRPWSAVRASIGAANGKSLIPTLSAWDGSWYLRIAATGYSALSAGVDANGHVVPETGSSRTFEAGGRATGSFFHLIAEAK